MAGWGRKGREAGRGARGYRRSVTTSARAGRPVVLVHGVRTSSAIWEHQVRTLEQAGHACRTVELPAHGGRAGDRFTLDGALAAVDAAVRGCAAPPLLVGMSLGGFVSLAYAAARPGRVAGLVLAGCSAEIRGKPVTAYRRIAAGLVGRLRLRGAESWSVVTDVLSELRGHSGLRDLRHVTVPVDLVNGARDPMRIDELRFLRAGHHVRLTVVRGAGHDVNLDAPEAFDAVVAAALHRLDRHAVRDRRPLPHRAGTGSRARRGRARRGFTRGPVPAAALTALTWAFGPSGGRRTVPILEA